MDSSRTTLTTSGTLLAIFLVFAPYAAAQPTLTTLHNFTGSPSDGATPYGHLVIALGRVLYGATTDGGAASRGTVFSLTPPSEPGGSWSEQVYSLPGGRAGNDTQGGVVIGRGSALRYDDALRNCRPWHSLFAKTASVSRRPLDREGSPRVHGQRRLTLRYYRRRRRLGLGVLYSLTPTASPGDGWIRAVLHSFTDEDDDRALPEAGVAIDINGVLYGTTNGGGSGQGTVYSLTPSFPGGPWSQTVLHSFSPTGDGAYPFAGVVIGSGGVPYGATGIGSLPTAARSSR